jgi:hypothetical protein
MTESSKPPSWDVQPTTLARHIVNLEEKYAEHVSAQVVSLLETGVMTDRGKVYVYNALHALVRTIKSFSSLSTAARPYSLVSPPPGAAQWHELQTRFTDELYAIRALRAMSGSKDKTADFTVIISTHTASTSCPGIAIAIPWADVDSDYTNELTNDQGKRYKIAPEELATMGRILQQSFICSGIEPLTTRKEYSSTICGCSAIRELLTLRDEYAPVRR